MTHVHRRALALVLGALLLTGCGGDDPPQPASSDGTQQLTVTETDFELDPADVQLKPGLVEVQVTNDGKVVHALAIETSGERRSTGNIDPGRTASLKAQLKAGRYTWFCPIANHRERGMSGTLTVGDGPPEAAPSAPAEPSRGYGY